MRSNRVTSASPVLTTTAETGQVVATVGCILSVESILIISTNLLVAIALVLLIHKKRCQSWYFVLNLAIADILVGMAITGIATDALQGRTSSMDKDTCLLRMAFIIAPSAASILTMFFISLDRYVAIKMPLRYSQLMSKKMVAGALVPLWLVAMTVGFLPSMVEAMQRDHYTRRIQARQEGLRFLPPSRYWGHVKALRTVAVLVGCFTLCWCPFFVVSIVQVLCPSCQLYRFLENHLWLLGLSNSLINPLVYACWQREVRNQIREMFAYIKVKLCCKTRSETADRCHTNHTTVTQIVKFHEQTLPVQLNSNEPVTISPETS